MKDENIEGIINGELLLKSHHSVSDFTPGQLKRLRKEFGNADYLTAIECCIWLGVSRRTLYKMIRAGKIAAIRITCSKQGPYKIDVGKTKKLLELDS